MSTGYIQTYDEGGGHVIHEEFSSIFQMLDCLEGRENNSAMQGEHSSTEDRDSSWSGTRTYKQAVELITKGYTDILDQLAVGMRKAMKSLKDVDFSKSYMIEDVQGAVPIVPNYLANLPKTMSYRKPIVKKVKTINVIYAPTANCGTSAEELVEAGVAMLSAIRVIEKSNVSIKLDCMFMDSKHDNNYAIATVRVKNYRDRLDLQKLCFPIANPAMLRRFGFRFLESVPGLTDRGFACGYGSTPDLDKLSQIFRLPERTVLLNYYLVKGELENDPKKIMEYINEKIKS